MHFKIYYNRKHLFEIVIIFHNITGFTIFLVKQILILVTPKYCTVVYMSLI